MNKGIESLYNLQLRDNRIKELEGFIAEIPKEIRELEEERDGKETIVENTKKKLNENVKERETLEKEIAVIKEKIKKYKDQMSKATTNKEYQGFMTEIKYEEENISAIEEKIIEKMVESDEIMEEIRQSEAEYRTIANDYNAKIGDLNSDLEKNRVLLSETEKNREELRSQIPETLLKTYDQLAKKKDGIAVSYVESDFCGVCNVKIRPQRLNELIVGDGMHVCENCGRILFLKSEKSQEKTTSQ